MSTQSPGPSHYAIKRVLNEVLTSGRWWVVLVAAFFLVSFHWFATTTHEMIMHRTFEAGDLWSVAPFPLVTFALWYIAQRVPDGHVRVWREDPLPYCKALIIFLSPLGKDEVNMSGITGELKDPKVRKQFDGPWRMPLEAIAHHLERPPLTVMIIPSSDTPGQKDGTYRLVDLFKQKMRELAGAQAGVLELDSLINLGLEWSEGADFEDGANLNKALETAYQTLRGRFRERDILVDITGGQKLCSVIAAAITFARDRRFQYVSTRDRKISVYDLSYNEEP